MLNPENMTILESDGFIPTSESPDSLRRQVNQSAKEIQEAISKLSKNWDLYKNDVERSEAPYRYWRIVE